MLVVAAVEMEWIVLQILVVALAVEVLVVEVMVVVVEAMEGMVLLTEVEARVEREFLLQ
jgi:hypothetical protein